ncbi:MAG: beta-galactosidase [Lachnospiraceae bacterium]|nr:beta-galactosidase [Lachnospiraceae bacterium]
MSSEQKILIPRPEHPRPQFFRDSWRNLNGTWDFDYDFGDSKKEQGWADKYDYPHEILVPFCPESKLSGIGYTDYMNAVWYHRSVNISAEELSGRVLIHFGAVDYKCEVFVNGKSAGVHIGGYTSFAFDITELLVEGENHLVVYASDHVKSHKQPSGKQSFEYASKGCYYTRTTGIWQTVWLEFVSDTYLASMELIPDPDNACAHIKVFTNKPASGLTLKAEAELEGVSVGAATVSGSGTCTMFTLSLSVKKLWEIGSPALYDLQLSLTDGETVIDTVSSYFGLRTIELSGGAILLNHKPVFQRLVLDQGFYPDGIYTAPTEEALKRDIELSMALGFNGARLHEKVFEERFLYWADKLGYIVWGEYPNWGIDISEADALCTYLPEWLESVKRDFNHPSIVGWCPFNETWDFEGRRQNNRVLSGIYHVTKAVDPTRPVIDTSGNYHVITDIYDVHNYEQDPEKWKEFRAAENWYDMYDQCTKKSKHRGRQQYKGEPYFVSEYGGTWWNAEAAAAILAQMSDEQIRKTSWGYGKQPLTEKEAGTRIAELTKVLLEDSRVCAFCYTQLTDVEQEQNGLYNYDRTPKFSEEVYKIIREGFMWPAAIEEK